MFKRFYFFRPAFKRFLTNRHTRPKACGQTHKWQKRAFQLVVTLTNERTWRQTQYLFVRSINSFFSRCKSLRMVVCHSCVHIHFNRNDSLECKSSTSPSFFLSPSLSLSYPTQLVSSCFTHRLVLFLTRLYPLMMVDDSDGVYYYTGSLSRSPHVCE